MTRQNNQLFKLLMGQNLQNAIFTSNWLRAQGITSKLTWWYVHSGWLEYVGSKAYKRTGSQPDWAEAVAAIQSQLKIPLFVGGKTALQLLGKAHYIPMGGIKSIALFTLPGNPVPNWLTQTKLFEVKFLIHKSALFTPEVHNAIGLTEQEVNNIQMLISTPERAIIEVFLDVPNRLGYEESLQLMENLPHLRSQVVQKLLENCRSIKVKRLFLHTAEICQHAWLKDLNLKKIDLGKGKRRIGSGGRYDAKYQVSAPIIKQEDSYEKDFLSSVNQGFPQWELLKIPGIEKLPSIQWKIMNIRKLEKEKHMQLLEKLNNVLQV